ncbi:MAG TPA: lysozyme inhibitor LprI family protein, partial [Pseudoxanthomonas sp.]|nr:lysozyme inhibitor LprI family protein [Pseudoxanthomonas sp.]
ENGMIYRNDRTSYTTRLFLAVLLVLCAGLAGCSTHRFMVVEELSKRSRITTSELKQLLAKCDHTQLSMNICAFRDFVATDLELDAALEAKHESVPQQCHAEIDRTQAAWETERDRACNEETEADEGGSMRPMLISACKTTATRERLLRVKAIRSCSEV